MLLVAIFAILLIEPPPPLPDVSAYPTQFSAERALQHIKMISQRPRPTGSSASAEARDYIFGQLRSLGLSPEVQRATSINSLDAMAATVENIVARLEGTQTDTTTKQAILLVSHYDSAPSSPGASDDGAGVGTLLEIARAIKAGNPFKNDVIFLFTDGEEIGLLGAQAFVQEHPFSKDVGLVLNFEARGTSGPAYTFETSSRNGALIAEFASAVPRPLANSLMYSVYQMLLNDTDFTIFKNAGYAGFNFAYIEGNTFYHSMGDNIENVHLNSVQHLGSYGLSLTEHFGNLEQFPKPSSDAIYFDILGRWLVHYSLNWAFFLAILVTFAYVAVMAFALRKKQASLPGILVGFLTLFALVILVGGVSWLLLRLIDLIDPINPMMFDRYNRLTYWKALLGSTVALTSALQLFASKKVGAQNLTLGVLLGWSIFSGLLTFFLPGVSYVFVWPLLFSLIGIGVQVCIPQRISPRTNFLMWTILAIPVLVLIMPLVYALGVALGSLMMFIPMILMALAVGLLIPQLEIIAKPYRWALPALGLLVAFFFLGFGSLNAGYDNAHPRHNYLTYGFDADKGQAYWISYGELDNWLAQFLPADKLQYRRLTEFFPYSTSDFPTSLAPNMLLQAPELEVLEDTFVTDEQTGKPVRALRLHISSARKANAIRVYLISEGRVLNASIAGVPVEWDRYLEYWAPPESGFDFSIALDSNAPVKIVVIDRTLGLPDIPGFEYQSRPPDIIEGSATFGNSVLVSKAFELADRDK